MKKVMIALLVLTFLVGMTGVSFADSSKGGWFTKWKSGASIKSDIKKKIKFENEAESESGCATAIANTSNTDVNVRSRAIAEDIDSLATNDSDRIIENTGNALSYSGAADALNDVTNNEEECIKDNVSNTSDVEVTVDADIDGCCPPGPGGLGGSDGHRRGDSGCSATIDGDICIDVEYENEAEAKSGDAFATGNISNTEVRSRDEAFADDGGIADNDSDIRVTNDGEAVAYSGSAVATNEAQNHVKIDIQRDAECCKTVDIFKSLTEGFIP